MERIRQAFRRLVVGTSGQAVAEYATTLVMLLGLTAFGGYALIKFMPETLNSLQYYLDGFYLALGYPIG